MLFVNDEEQGGIDLRTWPKMTSVDICGVKLDSSDPSNEQCKFKEA